MIERKYRTFWRRFFAEFADGLVLLPVSLATGWVWRHAATVPLPLLALHYLVSRLLFFIYEIYFLGTHGQTPGKMALGVVVLDVSERRHVSYRQALLRNAVPLGFTLLLLPYQLFQILTGRFYLLHPGSKPDVVSWLLGQVIMVWFLLEIVTMTFNSKRRALHDFIAGSVVVKASARPQGDAP